MLLSEGQMSDYKGAALMIDALPPARQLLADKGYDADWFRRALAERGIMACIPACGPFRHCDYTRITRKRDTIFRRRHRLQVA